MELIVTHATGGPLVRDYLAAKESALEFFAGHYADASSFEAKAREVDARFDREARERAVAALTVPPGADPTRLEQFVERGGYMVTTGQQPGLFGGPMYSVYKALTAVRLAEALEERLGVPVIPVFWVASEDHDWAEANHAHLIGVDNELHRFEVTQPDPDRSPPLYRIPMGADVATVVEAFASHLPETEFTREHLELLRAAFVPGETIPAAFHRVMHQLLGRFGIFFTDAADGAVKAGTADVLLHELARSEEHEGRLRDHAAALDAAGYGLQVPILEGGVNLFMEGPAGRERLYRDPHGFHLRVSGAVQTESEVRDARDRDPSVLSPNVLLRPVAESALFPTLSYVAGPGEMAYFGQLGPYFGAFGMTMPVVYPRFGAMAIESKIRKVLDKFSVELEGLKRPFHEVAGDIAREEVPDAVRAALGELRGSIGGGAGALAKATRSVDPTLKGPVDHFRSQAFEALSEVERKVLQAVKRENEIALAQLEKAQLHLYPLGKPSERVQSPFYFLARYGGAVLDRLFDDFTVNLR